MMDPNEQREYFAGLDSAHGGDLLTEADLAEAEALEAESRETEWAEYIKECFQQAAQLERRRARWVEYLEWRATSDDAAIRARVVDILGQGDALHLLLQQLSRARGE
jgi:hypothetical protein